MQIAVITGPSYEIASSRIKLANTRRDGIELRLDLFFEFDIGKIKELVELSEGQVVLTLRSKKEGGGFVGSEEKRLRLLQQLFTLSPNFIDIEHFTNADFVNETAKNFPSTKIISSYHDFEKTPRDLMRVLNKMAKESISIYKICSRANSISDSYKMLRFIQKACTSGYKFIGLCMGDYGKITRKEGVKWGNFLNYTILNQKDNCAPGLHFA